MNDLSVVQVNESMTSLEIAELTGKNHQHVCRDLRKLDEAGVIALLSFQETEKDSQGKSRTIYNLPKRETENIIDLSSFGQLVEAGVIDVCSFAHI